MTIRLLALLLVCAAAGLADESAEFFEKQIRPVLVEKCQSCHGPKVRMAGLDLSTAAGFAAGSDSGPMADEERRLLAVLRYDGRVKMPPSGKLPEPELRAFEHWVAAGAQWPHAPDAAATGALTTRKSGEITAEDRAHWAFQPIRKPAPPQVANSAWVRRPLDRFILSRLEKEGIQPAQPASRLTLLRRVTFDLTGLPPTPEEIEEFLDDKTQDALAKIVDHLLASPAYGEKWGRHWLDVARYADSTGMDEDHVYPHAWRYRDYVVRAINEDKPYDRFLVEQIAGDILVDRGEAPVETAAATGFLALGPKPLAQQDRTKMVYDVIDEQIDTVSKAVLGLTVACARCHDHKFDPIRTADYYGLAAIFANTKNFRNYGRPGSVSYVYERPLDTQEYARWYAHRIRLHSKFLQAEDALAEYERERLTKLADRLPRYLEAAWQVRRNGQDLSAIANSRQLDLGLLDRWVCLLDFEAAPPHWQAWSEATEQTIGKVSQEYSVAYSKSLKAWLDRVDAWRKRYRQEFVRDRNLPEKPEVDPADEPMFAAVTFDEGPFAAPEPEPVSHLLEEWEKLEDSQPEEPELMHAVTEGEPVQQHVFLRGDHQNKGPLAPPCVPAVIAGEQPRFGQGSGRLELARWLTAPTNPLTARVIVNRVWQWHFGQGIVRTPSNWGKTGEAPTHPELLDYLAINFVENGWSLKALHREILLSAAYAMSSEATGTAQEQDPANRLFSRFERRKLTVEEMRDAMLAIDETLDPTMGGSLLPKGERRPKIAPDQISRRTLYLPVRRGSILPLLSIFDFGDATTSSEGRGESNIAPQALFFLNSQFVADRSLGIAKRLLADLDPGADAVEAAFWTILNRPPNSNEIDQALSYTAATEQRLGGEPHRTEAWQSLIRVLLASNEFSYLN